MGNKLSKIHDLIVQFMTRDDKVAERLAVIEAELKIIKEVLVSLQTKVQPKK